MNLSPGPDAGKIIIAIDGYSSCGKSTMAKAIAKKLGYRYIDSGAMYRAVTLFVQQHGLSLDDLQSMSEDQLEAMLDHIHVAFHINPDNGHSEVYLNEINVEKKIRDLKVSDWVSPVSAIPVIRHRMVALQQGYGNHKGIVMDGRDIGTMVFPHAELKIFMTANKEVRAKRRFDEFSSKGFMVTMDEVLKNIVELIPAEWLQWNDTTETPQQIKATYLKFLMIRKDSSDLFIKEADDARKTLI